MAPYLDNNATTGLDPEVLEAMGPYLTALAGNPSSRHAMGRHARRAVDVAARQVADGLGCEPKEVVFVSGASEANNLAILGTEFQPGQRVLVNPTEHPSALEPARRLAQRGVDVVELCVDSEGLLCDFENPIAEEARLVVVQLSNSETGCIQPIEHIADLLPKHCRLHVDAVQAVGRIAVDFKRLKATTMSLSGHKIHGPPGIGALIVREGIRLRPLLFGGEQQQSLRPGTEPVALIVGLGKAVELATKNLAVNQQRLAELRDRFESAILARIPNVVRNGPAEMRLRNTTNLSFLGAKAESLVIALDLAGVCCSAGTACASGSLEPSAVLTAMKLGESRIESAVRFSVSRFNHEAEIDQAVAVIERTVRAMRSSGSPPVMK